MYYGLINLLADDVAKVATTYKDKELIYFRALVKEGIRLSIHARLTIVLLQIERIVQGSSISAINALNAANAIDGFSKRCGFVLK